MKNKTIIGLQKYKSPIVIQEDTSGGHVATCPIWNEAYAQGESAEEGIKEIVNFVSSLRKLYKEENLRIPLALVQ